MRLFLAAFAAFALAGCNTTKGALQDFSAAVNVGKAAISYDPTNGTVATIPPDIFGPVKTYAPVPQNEK